MTGWVSSRYYRAPEIMLTCQSYSEQVDIWSAGRILAEMLQGKPFFTGRDPMDQLCAITELLGTPDENILARTTSKSVSLYENLPAATNN
jgi:p38 MAP kinase